MARARRATEEETDRARTNEQIADALKILRRTYRQAGEAGSDTERAAHFTLLACRAADYCEALDMIDTLDARYAK